ncbi:uncharacterized protein LOC111899699 [Lactuca sativa]|uniref:Aspartic peptidase DDI1-type domain-containing protein n=1 Tax=Lactuca sativa TaxID=4236 RepID=A0A9R1XC05_LACSA|nr:uncharacterized protein LOC111899699 [Lactuca sativa]KAJ0208705.1 hypothetical protein LSAT_V11C400185710 [Lactuca sativa]
MGDPGSITVPCQFGNFVTTYALADSGASINIMPYPFFKKLNLPELKPIYMTIHLADKTVICPKGVCEDLLIKVDTLVFPADFVVVDMEKDPKVPIILGRPFLNTACVMVDMHESTLTLRVGDDSVTFFTNQEKEQEKSIEDKTSSIELADELLEKRLLEGNEDNEDLSNFKETNSTFNEKNLKDEEAIQVDNNEWLEDEKSITALKNKEQNSSIRLHTNNQEKKGDKLTTRTKPRASVYTTFQVFTFKPPDSQAYEESEVESVTSSDAEMMIEKAIEVDKGRMDTMGHMVDERKKKCGKGIKRKSEGNDTKMRKGGVEEGV